MPYALRNADGVITSLHAMPGPGHEEKLPANHPDVLQFLTWDPDVDQPRIPLQSDLKLIRVIEDVIDLLVSRNIIMFTDLPEAAREKIMQHKTLRDRLQGSASILNDEGGII